MAALKHCEFQLIRYVPDPLRNEFVNIGVLLRAGEQSLLRFTRDWSRVRCLDSEADTQMLEALEIEVGRRLHNESAETTRPILSQLQDSLSNGVQITESKGHLAESVLQGLEELMRLYVDSPRREKVQRRSGRSGVLATMRTHFEEAGVWALMRKHIPAAEYTRAGDPLRIDCGYRNGMVKMFQAVSLETDAVDAKLLAFSAQSLREGVQRLEKIDLLLTAIIEPILWPEGEGEPGEDSAVRYQYAVNTMKEHEVRVLTTSDLANLAETARRDLRV